jgi:hypothetical protein
MAHVCSQLETDSLPYRLVRKPKLLHLVYILAIRSLSDSPDDLQTTSKDLNIQSVELLERPESLFLTLYSVAKLFFERSGPSPHNFVRSKYKGKFRYTASAWNTRFPSYTYMSDMHLAMVGEKCWRSSRRTDKSYMGKSVVAYRPDFDKSLQSL